MRLYEFLTLDKHAARTAAGVKDPAFIWLDHLDKNPDNRSGGVELPALLPFRICELSEEVFINPSQDVL